MGGGGGVKRKKRHHLLKNVLSSGSFSQRPSTSTSVAAASVGRGDSQEMQPLNKVGSGGAGVGGVQVPDSVVVLRKSLAKILILFVLLLYFLISPSEDGFYLNYLCSYLFSFFAMRIHCESISI